MKECGSLVRSSKEKMVYVCVKSLCADEMLNNATLSHMLWYK